MAGPAVGAFDLDGWVQLPRVPAAFGRLALGVGSSLAALPHATDVPDAALRSVIPIPATCMTDGSQERAAGKLPGDARQQLPQARTPISIRLAIQTENERSSPDGSTRWMRLRIGLRAKAL